MSGGRPQGIDKSSPDCAWVLPNLVHRWGHIVRGLSQVAPDLSGNSSSARYARQAGRIALTHQSHWDEVYRTRPADSVSWFQPDPTPSLAVLDQLNLPPETPLIDIGGGASNLVDALLRRGWLDLTVLDISAAAFAMAKARLKADAARVTWLVHDIADWVPKRTYGVWHDRAVFHFLAEPTQREGYRRALTAAVAPGGHVIVATFAPDGPDRCSGLPVCKYDEQTLAAELGPELCLLRHWREEHRTPGGSAQMFNWCVFERV